MTISTDLQEILNIRSSIEFAITDKGGEFHTESPRKFDTFPTAIYSIPTKAKLDPDSFIYVTYTGVDDTHAGDVVIYPKMWEFNNNIATGGRDKVCDTTIVPNHILINVTGVDSITILNGITEIKVAAFKNCSNGGNSNNKFIKMPNTLLKIGYGAFSYNNWHEIIIPDSVTEIGERAFEYCGKCEYLEVGEGVTSIGNSAFYHMYDISGENFTGLKKVRLKMFNVPSQGEGADDLGGLDLIMNDSVIEVPITLVDEYKAKYPDLASYFVGF